MNNQNFRQSSLTNIGRQTLNSQNQLEQLLQKQTMMLQNLINQVDNPNQYQNYQQYPQQQQQQFQYNQPNPYNYQNSYNNYQPYPQQMYANNQNYNNQFQFQNQQNQFQNNPFPFQQLLQSQQQSYPTKQPFQVSLKSIMLKPLEYYSQAINGVQFPQGNQNIPGQIPMQQLPFHPSELNDQQIKRINDKTKKLYQYEHKTPTIIKPETDDFEMQTTQTEWGDNKKKKGKMPEDEKEWGPGENQVIPSSDVPKKNELKDGEETGKQGDDIMDIKFPQNQQNADQQNQKKDESWRKVKSNLSDAAKSTRARRNLRNFKKMLIYVMLYFHEYSVGLKRGRIDAIQQKGAGAIQCMQHFLDYFKYTSGKHIKNLCNFKGDFVIGEKKKILEEELKKRQINLKNMVKVLIKSLVNDFNAKYLNQEAIDFLVTMTHDYYFLPQNFLLKFEVLRVEFTAYGQTKNMKKNKSIMFLLTLLVLRVYLFRLILKPWVDYPEFKKKESLQNNNIYVGSVIYEILVEYIKEKCLKPPLNQAHLANERKTFERPLGPLVLDRYHLPEDPEEVRTLRLQEEPLILGLEPRENIKVLVDNDPEFVQEIKAYIEDFGETLFAIVTKRQATQQEAKVKLRIIEKLKNMQSIMKVGSEKEYKYQMRQLQKRKEYATAMAELKIEQQ